MTSEPLKRNSCASRGYTFIDLPSEATTGGTKREIVTNSQGERQEAIVMRIGSDANAVHEITHAFQGGFEKSIGLNGDGAIFYGKGLLANWSNAVAEINAYSAQYGFDPNSLPSSTTGGVPQTASAINSRYVAGINDKGGPLYPNVVTLVNSLSKILSNY